jgi:hypothetical protein
MTRPISGYWIVPSCCTIVVCVSSGLPYTAMASWSPGWISELVVAFDGTAGALLSGPGGGAVTVDGTALVLACGAADACAVDAGAGGGGEPGAGGVFAAPAAHGAKARRTATAAGARAWSR